MKKLNGLKAIARITAYGFAGCDPRKMGLGPVSAIRKVLNQAKLSMNDIDYFDINEAFAPQVMAVAHDLGIPDHKLNVNGGSLVMGHPLGASANRNVLSLANTLLARKANYGGANSQPT